MEYIGLRIVLTVINVAIFLSNCRVVPNSKIERALGAASSAFLGAGMAGIWLWF